MLRAYDYECPKGHKFEAFMTEYSECVPCREKECLEIATHVWSFHYNSCHAQRFDPVVIHKDAQGNIRFPAHKDAPLPPGFQRVELTDVYQVRNLEKEVNRGDREKAERFRISRQTLTDGQLKENRRVMDNIVKGFSPRGRKFYDAMRRMSERKQQLGPKQTNPEFVVDAFSRDASNRDDYYDERMSHGSHKGRK